MNERIRALRHTLQLSQKEFARQIGLKQNAISYMERPGATVTEQNIRAICAQFGVREDWLRSGSGEMFREGEREQRELMEIFDALGLKVSGSVSSRSTFLLCGANPQQRKIDQAVDRSVPIFTEDEFWSVVDELHPSE